MTKVDEDIIFNRCVREQDKAKCVCGNTNGPCMTELKPICGDECGADATPGDAAAVCVVIYISFFDIVN